MSNQLFLLAHAAVPVRYQDGDWRYNRQMATYPSSTDLFIPQMVHDLRGPMARLRGQLEGEHAAKTASETTLATLAELAAGVDRVLRVLETTSPLEQVSGTQSSPATRIRRDVPDVLALGAWLNLICQQHAAAAEQPRTISLNFEPVAQGYWIVNRRQLTRIVDNLLSNAVRHGEGTIQVSVTAARIDPSAAPTLGHDAATGFAPERLIGLLKPSSARNTLHTEQQVMQLSVTNATRGPVGSQPQASPAVGHGYGLSSAAAIVAELGGSLIATNDRSGTVFSVQMRLPMLQLAHAADASARAGRRGPRTAPSHSVQPTVLLVDDQATARAMLHRALRHLPIRLQLVASIEEARKRLADQRPDLIISDYRLADGDGAKLAAHSAGTPMCILSAQPAPATLPPGISYWFEKASDLSGVAQATAKLLGLTLFDASRTPPLEQLRDEDWRFAHQSLNRAARNGDWETVANESHRLRGACRLCNEPRFGPWLALLEDAALAATALRR